MNNYTEISRQYKKFRNNSIMNKLLYCYRVIMWHNSPELAKDKIYNMIESYYHNISEAEKKKIYKDAKKSCYLYGPALDNYFKFRFYSLTKDERKKYSIETPTSLQYAWGYFNDYDYYYLFNDKIEFYKLFKKFFKRDVFLADASNDYEKFKEFCNKHEEVFIKPRNGMFGFGAKKCHVSLQKEIDFLWQQISNSGEEYIIEEVIHAEESIKEFHPFSINALRIVTVVTQNKPEVLCAYVRLGNNGKSIEHIYSGGIGASIDINSGVVCTQGVDQYNNEYIYHPYSSKQIVGYKFKEWEQCINLVKEMAMVVPQVRLVGWDVAINDKNKWVVVEGNQHGTFEVAQTTMHKGLQERLDTIIENEGKING